MPYYGVPIGLEFEEVAFGFNKQIVTGLLRERYGFDGVVCTDWGLLNDTVIGGQVAMVARAWGVEHLTVAERARKAIEAGVDQFGGEACPEVIVELVRSGQLAEARIDESVRRLLRDKFRLGLFDNPYLDVEAAQQIVGNPTFRAAGALAQRKSIVLLKNGAMPSEPTLPLRGRPKLYVERVAAEVAGVYAEVVQNIEDADLAILRLEAPYQPRDGSFLERLFHAGDLDFKDEEKARILGILERVPTIVAITLDRPAVIPEIAAHSAALLADFGAADDAILDVVFGRFTPSGKLPFELPSSMEAAQRQKSDVPYDSEEPLFRFGHGLSY
jgi:beta-glucosidase